jgi:hypothetical protein
MGRYCINDISKNNARNGLIQEVNYLRNNQQTNSIVITVPHRFDLDYNSCVNEEVRKFNGSLSKVANNLNKVTVVSAEMERERFTRHGLHYNRKGKRIMTKKILTVIQEIIGLQSENYMIPLPWKNTMQEHTKQLTGKEYFNKTISRDSTPKQDEKVRNRGKDEKYKDNQIIILDQEADHSYRRKSGFFMGIKLRSNKPLI